MARELACYAKVPCISTDDLSILFSYYTRFSLFDGGDYYRYYESSDVKTIRADHLRYQHEIGKMLIHFVKTKMRQEEDLILEGFALFPEMMEEFPAEQVRFLCLVMEEDLLRRRYDDAPNFSRRREERTEFDKRYLEKLLWINAQNREECDRLMLPCLAADEDTSLLPAACALLGL